MTDVPGNAERNKQSGPVQRPHSVKPSRDAGWYYSGWFKSIFMILPRSSWSGLLLMLFACGLSSLFSIIAAANTRSIPINSRNAAILVKLTVGTVERFAFRLDKPALVSLNITGSIWVKDADNSASIMPFIIGRKPDNTVAPMWGKWDYQNDKAHFVYGLEAGYHIIEIRAYNWQGSAFKHASLQANVSVTTQDLGPQPDWLPAINKWLRDVGFQDRIWIVAATRGPSFNLGPLDSSMVEGMISKMAISRGDIDENEDDNRSRPSDKTAPKNIIEALRNRSYFDDKWFIYIATSIDRFSAGNAEYQFAAKYGVNLWTRLFSKISLHANIMSSNIFGHFEIGCAGNMVFFYKGEVSTHGLNCQSASISTDGSDWVARNLVHASSSDGKFKSRDFTDLAAKYLSKRAAEVGGIIEFGERSTNYVEATITGVKGWVIKGGRQWEKVQISIALLGDLEKPSLRIFTDGRLASGINPPADTRYEYDMEPQYSYNLSQFSKAELSRFSHPEE